MKNIIFLFVILFYSSCYDSKTHICSIDSKKDFVNSLFHSSYYWASSTPNIDINDFEDEEKLFYALKNKNDRFSFILKKEIYNDNFINPTSSDFGFLTTYLKDINKTIVLYVSPNSPASKAGIVRSDMISGFKIIDKNVTNVIITSKDGINKDINLTQKVYIKKEVSKTDIFTMDDKKIGYFVLNSFVGENIIKDLDKIFLSFKSQNIKELVVDLRYNMGGNIDTAAYLATLISGEKSYSNIFQYHMFNKQNSDKNSISYFKDNVISALNLNRVFILTSKLTASASESLISALRAKENDMDVIIIGTQTYGKPYSMYAVEYCDKVYFPILMKNFNSDFIEDYDEGFIPTCNIVDDYYHDFGDLNESLLKEAVYYIQNESCSY